MAGQGQNRPNEEHRPNGCFLIGKRTLREVPVNGRLWPIPALRRHRKSDRLCDSHERLISTHFGHSGFLIRTSAFRSVTSHTLAAMG